MRFVVRSLFAVFATLVLVVLIGWFAYLNRARIVNDSLGIFVEPFEVSVDRIDFYPIGQVTIKGLELSPANSASAKPFATIPEVTIGYRFAVLKNEGKVDRLRLSQPHIYLDQEHLDAFQNRPEKEDSKVGFDLEQFARFTESLKVVDATLAVDVGGLPSVKSNWELWATAFTFDADGLATEPIEVHLGDFQFGEGIKVGAASAAFRLDRNLTKIQQDELIIGETVIEITPRWLSNWNQNRSGSENAPTGYVRSANPVEWILDRLVIDRSTVRLKGFDGKDGRSPFPDLEFETSLDVGPIRYHDSAWMNDSPFEIAIENLAWGKLPDQLLAAESVTVGVDSLNELIQGRIVDSISIESVDALLNDASIAAFRSDTPSSPVAQTEAFNPADDTSAPSWLIRNASVQNGKLILIEKSFDNAELPRIETEFDGKLEQLSFGSTGFKSEGEQLIRFAHSRIWAPGSFPEAPPFAQIQKTKLRGHWNKFNFDNSIDQLHIEEPKLTLTDEALAEWLEAPDAPRSIGPTNRPVYKVEDLEVTAGKVVADSTFAEGLVPKIHSDFSITTRADPDVPPMSYQLDFRNFQLRNHPVFFELMGPPTREQAGQGPQSINPVAEEEVISVDHIEILTSAKALQRDRSIERIELSGATLLVGNGLKSIADHSASSNPAKSESDSTEAETSQFEEVTSSPTWIVEQLAITQSRIRFEALLPQIEGLEFAIQTELEDVPLSTTGLLSQERMQKVELAGIEIKDPYDSFITVAELPTLFAEFSLAGLARQEIEKIDLIGPSLHVGQGLFWWIDYQRNFRAQNEGASVALEEGGPLTAEPPTPIPKPEVVPTTKPDWTIKTISAAAGKIIIAPTGVPIGVVPFPFNATTNMNEGSIELKLSIPGEDHAYEFPQYEATLFGLTGDVEFNVPVKQVDNNLVQTFTLRRGVWKDFEAENLYLTVTFDATGIYGKLGGDAYNGYVEGAFNYYLNDPGKWDAWVAGSDFDAGPLTAAIVPDNFLMQGNMSLQLVSEGREKTIGETIGEFTATTPGWFDITKLDQILNKLPSDWTQLQQSLAEVGLLALKRFDYETGAGSLSMTGRSGELQFRFLGDYGIRELNLHLHDQRETSNELDSPLTRSPVSGVDSPPLAQRP
ncbi:MAG: hypothetical protein AAGA96_13365 [Verrucomicrobiota bacterium]